MVNKDKQWEKTKKSEFWTVAQRMSVGFSTFIALLHGKKFNNITVRLTNKNLHTISHILFAVHNIL